MINNFMLSLSIYWENVLNYLRELYDYPVKLISLILDLTIVFFIILKIIQLAKSSRAMQLIKGLFIFVVIILVSDILHLTILHSILTAFLPSGVLALIIIFQPELRRALEQIGTNKFSHFFGMDKDIVTRTKEDIYKIVIAVEEMAKTKTGALIVLERDIKIDDIITTGITINSDISPQLLVNIFVPNTPLHDGAVIISKNKIVAAACILPLASNRDIAKELGTRHRAAIGISKESDAIAIVVSEESGKVSIAKDGTLIADVKEETLKKILIKNIITNRLEEIKQSKLGKIGKNKKQNKSKENAEENNEKEPKNSEEGK